jgi:hypothetical protein
MTAAAAARRVGGFTGLPISARVSSTKVTIFRILVFIVIRFGLRLSIEIFGYVDTAKAEASPPHSKTSGGHPGP